MIFVKANGANNLKLKLNNTLILNCNGEVCSLVPIELKSDSELLILGECKNLKISLLGGYFDNFLNEYLIPNLNYCVCFNGDCEILEYSNIEDVAKNEMTLVNNMSNILCMQSYILNNVNYIGCIINDNGVYYCTNLDNYANKIWLEDDVEDVVIAVSDTNNILYFVFVKDGKIYYQIFNSVNTLINKTEVSCNDNLKAKKLIPIEYIGKANITLFACCFDNNTIKLFLLYNDIFTPILTLNGQKIRFVINDNILEVIIIEDYKVSILKYNIDISKDIKNILTKQRQVTKENCNNCLKVNSKYIFFNFENYEILDENNI